MGMGPGRPLRVTAVVAVRLSQLFAAKALRSCFRTLMDQSFPIDAIVFALPSITRRPTLPGNSNAFALPAWLRAPRRPTERRLLLRASFVLSDWGAGTSAALASAVAHVRDPAAWILAVGCGSVLHTRLLESLLRFAASVPGSAVGASGWSVVANKGITSNAGACTVVNAAGPGIHCRSGVLVQRVMLDGLQPPPPGSNCTAHFDVWFSAHLARRRIHRAFLVDHTGSNGRCHTGSACVRHLSWRFGASIWRSAPRLAVCFPCPLPKLMSSFFAGPSGQSNLGLHASYACNPSQESAAEMLGCGLPTQPHELQYFLHCDNREPPEHALLRGVLLAERDASTVMLLPPTAVDATEVDEDWRALAPMISSLLACAQMEPNSYCSEWTGWRAVRVGALVCFNSDDEGLRQIYGCPSKPRGRPSTLGPDRRPDRLMGPELPVRQQRNSENQKSEQEEAKDAKVCCRIGSLRGLDGTCGLMIITTFLTTKMDPQRGNFVDANFTKIRALYLTALWHRLNVTVLYDDLPRSVLQRYACSRFQFARVQLNTLDKQYGLNDVRYFLFDWIVREHPEWRMIFILDAFDVQVGMNPCSRLRDDVLYVGSEPSELKSNPGVLLMFHDLGGKYNAWYRREVQEAQTLNGGIMGGHRVIVQEFLSQMLAVLSDPRLSVRRRIGGTINVDMAALNYVVHTSFIERAITGEPVHSVYKGYQTERTDVWFIHK